MSDAEVETTISAHINIRDNKKKCNNDRQNVKGMKQPSMAGDGYVLQNLVFNNFIVTSRTWRIRLNDFMLKSALKGTLKVMYVIIGAPSSLLENVPSLQANLTYSCS